MFDDEKIKLIRTMPEGDKITLIWVQLLCLAGRINDSGLVYMGQNLAYSDEMLSTILNHPINIMRIALKTLEQFGMIEVHDDGTIDIMNWEKHQNVAGMERVKDGNRERQRLWYYRNELKKLGIDPFAKGVPENSEELRDYLNQIKSQKPNVSITEPNRPEEDKEEEEDIDKDIDKEITTTSSSRVKTNVFEFYQDNIGVLSNYVQESLDYWIDDISSEVVLEAIKVSLEQGKATYSYINGILKNWKSRNVKSINDVNALKAERENQKKQQPNAYTKQKRVEEVPEHVLQQEQGIQQEITESPEEVAERQRKLDERLAKLFGGSNEQEN